MTETLYPSLSQSKNEQDALNSVALNSVALSKAHTDNLFIRLHELEKDLKHYRKLKKKRGILKNILHYSKYPIAGLLLTGDLVLALTLVGTPVAIVGGAVTVAEVISTNILEDTLVRSKTDYYHKMCKHLSKWIERMYVFKSDAEKDGLIDAKVIQQWKNLLDEYEKSLSELKKHEVDVDLKKLKEAYQQLLQKK